MALTTVPASMQDLTAQYTGFKNRIINGDMKISQRGTSFTSSGGNQYTLDRWFEYGSVASKFTIAQSSTAPSGYTNSLLVTSSAATSVGSSDQYRIEQDIEGFNVTDLGWGSVGAATVTLSFWVRSSLTGTFGGSLRNGAADRSYPFTYTIGSANTWEQKSVTVAGDTTGTWLTTNGNGMRVCFGLGVGSTLSGTAGSWAAVNYASATGATSVVGTSGATFYITGVQLEKGSTATSFDYRPYGTELALCQRYCVAYQAGWAYQRFEIGFNAATTYNRSNTILPVEMRAQPSIVTTGTASNYGISHGSDTLTACNAVPVITTDSSSTKVIVTYNTVASGLTAGAYGQLIANNNTGTYLIFTAEL